MHSKRFITAATVFIAVITAGCGSTTPTATASSPSPAASPSPAPSPAAAVATIKVAADAKLGQILVNGSGMTVYLFVADKGTASTCYTSCATLWPPVLTTGAPIAGTGATASLLGTTTRTDGKVEVTYAGHPLYYFIQDKKAGDTTGQGINGFGGLWWVLSASGVAITMK
jgi:predicted lipoprotein with Yx(FWY)xxD motif